MHNLISRQSAIDALEREKSLDERPITEIRWFDLGLRKAQDILSELPSAQQWIPCKWHTEDENLPKECKSVLVCIDEKSGYKIGVSYRSDYNRWEGYGRVNVVAWMPLPEPY